MTAAAQYELGAALWQSGRRHDAIAAWGDALQRDPSFVAPAGAVSLAQRYADACVVTFAAPFPLLWPRRTAGSRPRIVVLPCPATDAVASEAQALLLGLPADRFEVTLAALGATSPSAVAAFASAHPGRRIVPVTPAVDLDDAKRVALLDPDVLVDLAGLAASVGPLLARRPARTLVTVTGIAAPHAVPLVDGALAVDALGAAMERLRAAIAVAPYIPDAAGMTALFEGAVRAHKDGALPVARLTYERVLALQPGYAPAHFLLGDVLRNSGEPRRARAEFEAAVAAAPRFVEARIAAARAAQAAGDARAAVDLCTAGLPDAQDSVPLWRMLGIAQLSAGDAAAAATALQRAAALAPADADVQFNLGAAWQVIDAHDAAAAAYGAVLDMDRAHVVAYKNRGEVLYAAGRFDEWFANHRRFEANCPDALPMLVQALEVCHCLPDWDRLDAILDRIVSGRYVVRDETEHVDSLEQLLYLLLFFDVPPEAMLALARAYDAAARRVYGEPIARSAVRRPGRLRIGYLSADLRDHVMGKMAWQALQHHDKARFELFFYSLAASEDDWTARFRALADRFTVLAGLPERAAAEAIAADDLDLLVDLSTHTRGAMPGILAAGPARVQVSFIASAGTVGLSTVDFKLTDRDADLPESAAFQIERPLPMDRCVYPYRHVPAAASHPLHRAALGIATDAVVIGAFVSAFKLSRRCLGLWRDVLERVPRALLAFSPFAAAQQSLYLRLVRAAGIDERRIVFVPQGRDDHENQARYSAVDFVLDPMPYGGANGTLEALDCGVPVVTLVGARHGERTSYSILRGLGVPHTVARTPEEYVAIAARLAMDRPFMAEVRAAIAAGLAHSPLADAVGYTRSLERAYLTALAAKGFPT